MVCLIIMLCSWLHQKIKSNLYQILRKRVNLKACWFCGGVKAVAAVATFCQNGAKSASGRRAHPHRKKKALLQIQKQKDQHSSIRRGKFQYLQTAHSLNLCPRWLCSDWSFCLIVKPFSSNKRWVCIKTKPTFYIFTRSNANAANETNATTETSKPNNYSPTYVDEIFMVDVPLR